MSLYLKYRPATLDEVRGNSDLILTLKVMLGNQPTCPHSFLLHGPTGCGKTTIARIIAKELGSTGYDLREINSADFRGIDTIRDLIKSSQYMAMESSCICWIIDECFAKGTLIKLTNGKQIPIQDIQIGDAIQNLNGNDKVVNVFKNKVSINRVVLLSLSDGRKIFCSEDHLFLTTEGWVPAKKLINSFVFLRKSNNFVKSKSLLITDKNGKEKNLQTVWNTSKETTSKVLFSQMLHSIYSKACSNGREKLLDLWECVQGTLVFYGSYLRQEMWKYFGGAEKNWNDTFLKVQTEVIGFKEETFSNQRRRQTSQINFYTNEREQSFTESRDYIENETNKKNQWNPSYLERRERRQWAFNTTTDNISDGFRMGNGTFNKDRTFSLRSFWISNKICSRLRQSRFEVSNRNRWNGSFDEEKQIIRLEERKQIERIRVESITFYERGYNQQYFNGIIGDQERNQGYVNFYDLQVEKHPSYIANDILVHNCHKMSNDAQNALLKILEDTPPHVYFILCTTDPQKLLPTIKGRCSIFQVLPLPETEMRILLKRVARKEAKGIEEQVLNQIIESAKGHPRNALQILEQVLNVPQEQQLQTAKKAEAETTQAIDLCRALIKQAPWSTIAKILSGMKDMEAESVRRVVLGYCQSILLSGKDEPLCGLILEEFLTPFYDSGFPQLVYACYSIFKNK